MTTHRLTTRRQSRRFLPSAKRCGRVRAHLAGQEVHCLLAALACSDKKISAPGSGREYGYLQPLLNHAGCVSLLVARDLPQVLQRGERPWTWPMAQ